MKNIHILDTEKPSRLQLNVNTKKLILFDNIQSNNESVHLTTQHIYITSNEEIKEGDWFLEDTIENLIFQRRNSKLYSLPDTVKKIILTTDQDLIGVQAIDDEFLEWFVKNPNCEEVEIENGWGLEIDIETPYYKLIIPKEEQTTEEQLPTKWFKTEEIDTWVGDSTDGGRGKLVVLHQCGENKEELISQLKTLINGIESDFEWFAQ